MRNALRWSPALVVLLLCAGCYEVSETADVVTVRFGAMTRALLVGVPAVLLMAMAGLATLRPARVPALIMGGFVMLLSVLLVPGIVMDTVTLTREGLHQRTGFWFAPNRKGFDLTGTQGVEIRREADTKGWVQSIWYVRRRDGRVQRIDPGDLWDHNEGPLIERLRQYGVDVSRERLRERGSMKDQSSP